MDWLANHAAEAIMAFNSLVLLVNSIVMERGFASMDRRMRRIEIALFDLRKERNTL